MFVLFRTLEFSLLRLLTYIDESISTCSHSFHDQSFTMTVDPNKTASSSSSSSSVYRKSPLPVDSDLYDDKHSAKARHSFQWTSLIYPLLLALLLIIGTALLAILLTRRNSCQQQEPRDGSPGLLSQDNVRRKK